MVSPIATILKRRTSLHKVDRHLARPSPKIFLKKSFKLKFTNNLSFPEATKSKVYEAYLHNNFKRVTFIYHDFGSFTFELEEAKTSTDLA